MGIGKIARRTFLGVLAVGAGVTAFGYWQYRRPYDNPLDEGLADGEATFNPFVKIASDGTMTVITPRAEMGQGVQTTLAASWRRSSTLGSISSRWSMVRRPPPTTTRRCWRRARPSRCSRKASSPNFSAGR